MPGYRFTPTQSRSPANLDLPWIQNVEPTSVRGVFFRHVPAGGEPLFRPEYPSDGRWQRGEIVEGFYLAGDEETAWAEWYRVLAELGVPPMRQMPRDLWGFDVRVEGIADLSSVGRLDGHSLPFCGQG